MRNLSIIVLFLFVVSGKLVSAQDIYLVDEGSVKFTSDAPLELIEASTDDMQGALKTLDRTFVFRVPMKTFRGFNSDLQRTHFNTNYLETGKFPYTTFDGKVIEDVDFYTPGTYNVRGKGVFTCHGVEQERIIKCKLVVKPGQVSVTSYFTVLLDDHDIKIPSVVNQKIAEEIEVTIEIELKKQQ